MQHRPTDSNNSNKYYKLTINHVQRSTKVKKYLQLVDLVHNEIL